MYIHTDILIFSCIFTHTHIYIYESIKMPVCVNTYALILTYMYLLQLVKNNHICIFMVSCQATYIYIYIWKYQCIYTFFHLSPVLFVKVYHCPPSFVLKRLSDHILLFFFSFLQQQLSAPYPRCWRLLLDWIYKTFFTVFYTKSLYFLRP